MITETKREPEMGLTFEKVWAMFQETDRRFKETELQLKETDRKISRLGGRLGELVEHLIAPNMLGKFNALGYVFEKVGPNVRFVDKNDRTVAEVDIFLENGDVALAVEVKSKLSTENVQEHMGRMEKLRRHADNRGDRRKLIGAVAGAVIPEGVKPFALKKGFYVIEQAGDTVKIEVPEGFKPREW
jgi:hypothetical protein